MSLTAISGSNRFTECLNLIGYRGQPLLRVMDNPLRITLRTPPESKTNIVVDENAVKSTDGSDQQELRIVTSPDHVAIFWKESPLVLAVRADANTIHLRVDLRPLGIDIHDDPLKLHIEKNDLSNNSFANCTTAINLQ